jgi:peptidoglycan/xylan/chitin deacetylase (PgdA/CDA1 family)
MTGSSRSDASDAALSEVSRGTAVTILMYHGIIARALLSEVSNCYGYNIQVDALDRHLAYVSQHCNPISLAEMRTGRSVTMERPNVIVTFDDGYENNYTMAFPLLKRYRIPAVCALPTAFVCNQEPLWNDVLEYAVNHSQKERVRVSWAGATREFAMADLAGRIALHKWLVDECIRVPQERRSEFIQVAVDALEVMAEAQEIFRYADYRPLTAEQVSEMAASGLVEFASHSVHHYLLTQLCPDARRRELQESKDQMERLTGRPCTAFTVPGGFFNDDVLHDAWAAGYEVVMTSMRGRTEPGRHVLNRNVLLDGDGVQVLADMLTDGSDRAGKPHQSL